MNKLSLLILLTLTAVTVGCVQIAAPSANTALPTVVSFEASPSSIAAGQASTLRWEVINANSVEITQGIGTVALTGNRPVTPAVTTIYTLTASNPAGNTSATTQVIVPGGAAPATPSSFSLPVVKLFAVQPANIIMGGKAILQWDVSSSSNIVIEPNIGVVPAGGAREIAPTFTTTYKLTATNDQGSIVAATLLTVSSVYPSPDIPVIKSFTATPYVIHRGEKSVLSWESINASSANIDRGIGIVQGSGTTEVSPDTTTVYTLTASNPDGAQLQATVVNVK